MTFYRAFPVFSTAFAVFYLISATFNYALFTYHPLLHEIDLLAQPVKAGPAMYWYGWMTTAAIGALVVAAVGTFIPSRWGPWVQRAITFACVLAGLFMSRNAGALVFYARAGSGRDFLN